MKRRNVRRRFLARPAKTLLDAGEQSEFHSRAGGPLFPKPVFRALSGTFRAVFFLTFGWFGLLLLNSDGVVRWIGALGALRVTAALMAGISLTSVLLMLHYRRLYSCKSEGSAFFATTF